MNNIIILFLILIIGYLVGYIKFKNLSLNSSGILLVSLIFGHFGFELPSIIREFGLLLFVSSVGLVAGPIFFNNFKKQAFSFVFLGIFVIVSGSVLTILFIKLFNIPTPLAVGIMTGALTSTPGLAAVLESTNNTLASTGYGIAYPFGVVGVVLFVQLLPKILKIDVNKEALKFENNNKTNFENSHKKSIETSGIFVLSLTIFLGILLGKIEIPLWGNAKFSLSNSGGPLIVGLILGHFRKIGNISLEVPEKTLNISRELGMVIFLACAGLGAGKGFLDILIKHGAILFIMGIIITLLPMFFSYFIAKYIFKMDFLDNLGSICGGMTSTPALGSLIAVSGTNKVAVAYASTYPIALVSIVLSSQFISIFL